MLKLIVGPNLQGLTCQNMLRRTRSHLSAQFKKPKYFFKKTLTFFPTTVFLMWPWPELPPPPRAQSRPRQSCRHPRSSHCSIAPEPPPPLPAASRQSRRAHARPRPRQAAPAPEPPLPDAAGGRGFHYFMWVANCVHVIWIVHYLGPGVLVPLGKYICWGWQLIWDSFFL
jgi:hypothetical protein